MKNLLETFSFSEKTRQILLRVCEKHNIKQISEIVDIYRHKPDLFFGKNGFYRECWDEISNILSDPNNPYIPKDSVISFKKATLIVKRNNIVDELAELSNEIRQVK
ncbi:MAG: hypothetical protein V3S72_01905 [Desulfobacterales bacterium]